MRKVDHEVSLADIPLRHLMQEVPASHIDDVPRAQPNLQVELAELDDRLRKISEVDQARPRVVRIVLVEVRRGPSVKNDLPALPEVVLVKSGDCNL